MKIISYVTPATALRPRETAVLFALNPSGYDRLRGALLEALVEAGFELDPINPPSNWLELHSLCRRFTVNAQSAIELGQSQLQVGFTWPQDEWLEVAGGPGDSHLSELQVWIRLAATFSGLPAPDVHQAAAWAGRAKQTVRELLPSVAWQAPRLELALNDGAPNLQAAADLCSASHEGHAGLALSDVPGAFENTTLRQRLNAVARELKAGWPAWDAALAQLASRAANGRLDQPGPSTSIEILMPEHVGSTSSKEVSYATHISTGGSQ